MNRVASVQRHANPPTTAIDTVRPRGACASSPALVRAGGRSNAAMFPTNMAAPSAPTSSTRRSPPPSIIQRYPSIRPNQCYGRVATGGSREAGEISPSSRMRRTADGLGAEGGCPFRPSNQSNNRCASAYRLFLTGARLQHHASLTIQHRSPAGHQPWPGPPERQSASDRYAPGATPPRPPTRTWETPTAGGRRRWL